jgi:hypothetical protein
MSAMQASIRYTDSGVRGGVGVDTESCGNAKKDPCGRRERKSEMSTGVQVLLWVISLSATTRTE